MELRATVNVDIRFSLHLLQFPSSELSDFTVILLHFYSLQKKDFNFIIMMILFLFFIMMERD